MYIKNINDFKEIGNEFYIFGAGSLGKYTLNRIKNELSSTKILGFIDDNKSGKFENLTICKLNEVERNIPIIVASSYWQKISKILELNNFKFCVADLLSFKRIDDKTILNFLKKDLTFYTPNQFLFEVVENIDIIEPETLNWIKKIKNKTFYDIGASNGIYSILAAIYNNVIAIEPDISNCYILDYNIKLNNSNVIPINIALGEIKSIISISSLEIGEGFHGKFTSNSNRFLNDNSYISNILSYDLDSLIIDFNLKPPTHLKIDVDGAEESVLKGMFSTLNNEKLEEILIEIDDNNFNKINLILEKFNFKVLEKHNIAEITGSLIQGTYNYLYRK